MRPSRGGLVRLVRQVPARAGVAVAYVVALVATTLVFRTRSAGGRRAWLEWTSTNLVNLHDHPLPALVVSGLFTEGGLAGWVLTALVGLGVTNWALGNWRTAVLAAMAHVGGTLISQGILAYRIAGGRAPAGDRHIVDVGPSYVVAGALVAGAVFGIGAQRLPAAAGFALFAPNAFLGLPELDVTSVGHLSSVLIAVAVGWPLWRSVRPRSAGPPRLAGSPGSVGSPGSARSPGAVGGAVGDSSRIVAG